MKRKELTFKQVAKINKKRCLRWHKKGTLDWSVSDWGVAMAGEAGEVCNAIKKLNRLRDEFANKNDPGRQIDSFEEGKRVIGKEIADTYLYLDLLAQRLDLDIEKEIREKFNSVSEKYGFPDKL